MKTIVMVVVFTIVYVVCMDLVNKYMSNINLGMNESREDVISEENSYSVEIQGSVVSPGTYTVIKGSNLGYLITLAGGLKENADKLAFNSNAALTKGSSYYIPHKVVDQNDKSIKVSINTSTEAALDTLPGIGTVFAKRIVEYRVANGFFITIEDLMKVKGIGNSLFESIKDLICL